MGLWERMNNPDFNLTGFREVKMLSTETGLEQLVVLSNMEMLRKRAQSRTCSSYAERRQHSRKKNLNAVFINEGLAQRERLIKLNQIAIQQMRVLQDVENRKLLK